MHSIWGITAEDLSEWARRYEAASILPELVRRLLLATEYVAQIEMRSGAGVRLPGYDGVVAARMASPFCPAGASVWELSTADQPEKKATRDILKREKFPLEISAPETTYVVVTALRFPRKQPWVAEQVRRGLWRGVKVIDADDLAMWLAQCPAVAVWFASEHLGRPVSQWSDLRTWRRRWEQRTTPPLPADLVLLDRGRQQTELQQWLEQLDEHPTAFLRIAADSRDEACLFFAEVVLAEPEPESSAPRDVSPFERSTRLEPRVLIVESKSSWRTALGLDTSEPLVLVPMFSDFDPGERSSRHAIVAPAGASTSGREVLRICDPLPWRGLTPRLEKLLPSEGEARAYARESGGKLSALQARLGYNATPAWVDTTPRGDLIAFMFMGAWEPARDADAECVVSLGSSAEKLEATCVHLTTVDEAPSIKHGAGWRWVSHANAWQTLASKIADGDLHRFLDVAQRVLGEDDPSYERSKDERWSAIALGVGLRHSEMLREGIAESLVRLSLVDEKLKSNLGAARLGSKIADEAVSTILRPEWTRWASLSALLPTLAEASPKRFMQALGESLDRDGGVARLLMEEPELGMGHAPHTGLLWALETLGWLPKYMPRIARALAQLAESDPGGRIANRPAASLVAIFDIGCPQTLAEEEDRQGTLASILASRPEAGWELLLKLLRSTTSPRLIRGSRRPQFRRWGVPIKQEFSDPDAQRLRLGFALSLAIEAAGNSPERWCSLIEPRLHGENDRTILAALLRRKGLIEDPLASIWSALRLRLDLHYDIEGGSKTKRGVSQHLEEAYLAFEPEDLVARALPLFRTGLTLPKPHRGFRDKEEQLQALQAKFLRELAGDDDWIAQIERLLTKLTPDVRSIAAALASSPMADEIENKFLRGTPLPPWDGLLPGFLAQRRREKGKGIEWFAATLRRLVDDCRHDEAARAALALWSAPEVWRLIDDLGEPVSTEYWRGIHLIGSHEGPPQYDWALARLVKAKNVSAAFKLAAWHAEEIPTELALSTLELIISAPDSRSEVTSWDIDKILSELDDRDDVDIQRAAQIESLLSTSVGARRRPPNFLNRILGNSPSDFAALVVRRYRAEGDDNTSPVSDEDTNQTEAYATWAYRILESWGYPGRDTSDAEERERIVFDWAEEALRLTRDSDRQAVGEIEVARVLARVPEADDGHWPCIAARRLLESGRHPNLMRGMSTARRNQWGMRVRRIDDGQEEAAIAEHYTQEALALGKRWPRTSSLLEELADSFLDGSDRTAKWTRERRQRHGMSQSPTPLSASQSSSVSTTMTSAHLFSLSGLQCIAVGPAPSLSIDLSPRLNLFTGDNGLGKTFLLDTAWWVLTGSWPGTQAQPLRGTRAAGERAAIELLSGDEGTSYPLAHFDPRHDRWNRPSEWPIPEGLLIYVRVDGGFSVWDSERMGLGEADPFTSALHLTQSDVWERYELEGRVLCQGLLTDWLQWQSRHPETFDRFFNTVRALFEADTKVEPGDAIRLGIRDEREIPTLRLPRGDTPINLLSAGMKRILGLAYIITWAYERHVHALQNQSIDASPKSVIVLIDEVECHLHPKWQRALLPALLAQLEALQGEPTVQLIATTHAPFVTASCETVFASERDGLFVFDTDENHQVVVNQVAWAKHGDITDWVTSNVFGLDRGRSLEAERAINEAYAFMRGEATSDCATIDKRLREVLASDDEFWPRWIVTQQNGVNL